MTNLVKPDASWTAQKSSLHKMVLDVRQKLSKYNESVCVQSSVMCCPDPDEDILPSYFFPAVPKNVAKNIKNNALAKKKLLKEKSKSITLKQSYQKDREITKKKKLVSRQRKKSSLKIRAIRSDTKNRKVEQRIATKWVVNVSNNVIRVNSLRSNTSKALLIRKCRETMLQQNSPCRQKNIKNYFSSKQTKLLQKTEPKVVTNKKSSIPTNSNALSRTTMKSTLNYNYQSSLPLYYSSLLVKKAKAGTLLLDKSGKTPYQNSVGHYDQFLKVPPSTRTRLFGEQNTNVLNKRVTLENNLPRSSKSYEGCWLWQSVDKTTNSRDNGKQLLRSLRYNQMHSREDTEVGYVTSRFRRTYTIPDAICDQPSEENCSTSDIHSASSSTTSSSSRSSTKPGYKDECGHKSAEGAKHIDFDDNNVKENQNVDSCRSRVSTIKESTPEDYHKERKKARSVENTNILRYVIRRSTPSKRKRKNKFHLKARLNNYLEQNPRKMGDGYHHVERLKMLDILIENTTGDIKETETTDSAEYSNAKVCAKKNSESTRVVSTNFSNSIMSFKPIHALLWILKLFFGFRNS